MAVRRQSEAIYCGGQQSIQFLHFPTSDAITKQYCGAVAAETWPQIHWNLGAADISLRNIKYSLIAQLGFYR